MLWMAEYLGKEGNRLLKIIEEPPEETIFFLIARNQEDILNTIISRCQIIAFAPLSDDDISLHIHQTFPGLDEASQMQITYLANGDLGRALDQLENRLSLSTGMWLDWMRIAFKGNALEMVKWTDGFAKLDREAQKRYLHYGLHFLREMLISKVSSQDTVRLLDDEKKST